MSKTKYLQVTLDREIWEIPASFIAHARASYYAERDPDTTFDAEFAYTMNDNYEIKDWANGNMDWEDVRPHATLIHVNTEIDRAAMWSNADKEIVER